MNARTREIIDSIPGWLSSAEGDLLFSLARLCNTGSIVEIGSFQGKSTIYLAAGSAAGARVPVYAIDPNLDTCHLLQENVARSGFSHLVHPIIAKSEVVAGSFDKPIELLFIDGSHDEPAVELDWDLWVPKVIPGGYVAMHDTLLWPGPCKIAEQRILMSSAFVKTGVADSITFGAKRRSLEKEQAKLRQLRILLLKRISNLAARIPLPVAAKEFGSRTLRTLQR